MKYNIVRFRISTKGDNGTSESQHRDACDLLAALVGDAGFESFESTEDGVDGYVMTSIFDRKALDAVLDSFPIESADISYTVDEAEDKNWNSIWEDEGFEPIVIKGRCVIHDMHHVGVNIGDGIFDITIDAHQAFGTGTHETTRMIVGFLTSHDVSDKDVLDCGCGTGILSITASKCGARYIMGYDIDEWSVKNTVHNAALNGVANIEVKQGDAGVLNGTDKKFDIVMANINRNILLADMPVMRSMMSAGGTLILSGFYECDEALLVNRAADLGLSLACRRADNGWSMLVFTDS